MINMPLILFQEDAKICSRLLSGGRIHGTETGGIRCPDFLGNACSSVLTKAITLDSGLLDFDETLGSIYRECNVLKLQDSYDGCVA